MLLLATLLSSVGITVLGPASPAQADPACRADGLYIVFVRGSAEKIYDIRARAFHDQVIAALWRPPRIPDYSAWVEIGNLDASVPSNGQHYPDESGEYPAVGWTDWSSFRWGAPVNMDGYYNSVWKGVNELTTHLNDRASRCPNESIVVGGYSQGAEVVGYSMLSISDYTRSHIGYVALYGDPRATACSSGEGVSVPWRRGSASCAQGSLGMRNPYVHSALTTRTGSWCDKWDGVCTGKAAHLPPSPSSSHGTAYQDYEMADSAPEIASKAISKRNELNPNSTPMAVPSFTITPPDTSPDSPAAPPPPPTVKQVKRTTDHVGKRQVYAATKSAVTEAWWSGPGDPVKTSEVIHISQENIVGFDKVNEPDGTTQSVYTAVPDGVWETWWRPNEGIHHNKIITGLSGVRQVIADPVVESGQYTHRLYILAQDGPYEAWWREGGDGIHISRLDIVNDPVTMDKARGPDGTEQLYVATPTYVYELWWRPGESVHHGEIIHISQGDIRSLDKGDNLSDGGQLLYTGTSTTAWQSYWLGSTPSHGTIAQGQTNAIQIEKDVYNGVHELYLATGDHVQEYWWNGPNSGTSELIRISQNNITAFDKSNDGADQQVYTASGDLVYETWWRAGVSPTSSVLFKVAR